MQYKNAPRENCGKITGIVIIPLHVIFLLRLKETSLETYPLVFKPKMKKKTFECNALISFMRVHYMSISL